MMRALLPAILRPVTATWHRLRPSIRILMYHRVARLPAYDQLVVTPERFFEQMAHLAVRSRVVSLDTALAEIAEGGPRESGVVLTFDDGYLDNLREALPILQRHGIPATIFVTTRFCDQQMRHPRYPLEAGRLHLDWDEVRALALEPGISIGSHTMTHPFLTRTADAQAAEEIGESRRVIAGRIGRSVDCFCYPSGDFGPRERTLVERAGYRAAVTVAPGANRAGGSPYALRRTEVTDRDGPREFALKLAGAYDPQHLLLHGRREIRFARARAAAQFRNIRSDA